MPTYSNLKKVVYLSQAQYAALENPDPDAIYLTPDNFQCGVYVPLVDDAGNLSWSNNKGLPNPPTVNIMGLQGKPGEKGEGEFKAKRANRAKKAKTEAEWLNGIR